MKIKWYGTASLFIEGGNTRLLVDPYLKKYNKKLPPLPMEEATTAEAILITHPHFDHLCDIGTFLGAGIGTAYVSENGIACARANGVPTENMLPLAAGDTLTIGDITVRAYQSRHCKFDFATILGVIFNPRTYLHFKNGVKLLKSMKKWKMKSDIYALEFSCEGKKIMVLGSAGMAKNVEYPTEADLLVFPYQGRSRMHKYMIPFLERFRPKAVMLDHFDDAFPPFTHTINTKKFFPTIEKVLPGAKAFLPTENKWYEV